jgi:hypothetical protein
MYDITATHAGFATVQQKGVRVQSGQTVRIDVQMPVAGQQSLVTRNRMRRRYSKRNKTSQVADVTENLVANLPISSRRWEQFVC